MVRCVRFAHDVGDDGQELDLEAPGREDTVRGRVSRRFAQPAPDVIEPLPRSSGRCPGRLNNI